MTYFEILGLKANDTINKAKKEVGKFKISSKKHEEETEELAGYMTDYIEDLVNQGYSEEDALQKDKIDFEVQNPENPLLKDEYCEKLQHYIESMDPATQEAIGLIYGSRLFIGVVVGGITGVLGQILFNSHIFGPILWIMLGLGFMLGLALGMSSHANINMKYKK
ncbi:hypothetical protein [Clostridium sp. Marseille-Q2269]|uniref:hypothetical protein n=1 Tax=Clostridium sp. Marseille-Q2269 TaxID=2942205 RepID=UPI0020743AF8|nr:hypothetical protein [Clostridium sp. Marseille-Q2269]